MDQVTPLLSGKYHICTRKNLISCSKSANKSYVRTACPKLSTSLEQAVNIIDIMLILSDLLQGCSNTSDTVMI
jgi:hypothetical protein